MRTTLRKIGVSETDFIRECDVSFKQGARFSKWVDGSDDDFYYHPLVLPVGFEEKNLAPYWLSSPNDLSFSNAVCFQEALCEGNLAPKRITDKEFDALANYAYHLNAGMFCEFLKKHCIDVLGVEYIVDNVVGVENDDKGDIAWLLGEKTGKIYADLFIDCTGFNSLLIGKHYEVPYIDRSDVLFVDQAIAAHVPYQSPDDEVIPYTVSTGQSAGWVWDIGLQSRRGVGYVYSSSHTNADQAEETLVNYISETVGRKTAESLDLRKIPIKSGHRSIFWKNNCVAVGLSAGFLEPLEASALVLVELSAQMISDQLPSCREVMPIVAKRFNETFLYRWDRIIDFLKLHYILTKRDSDSFWRDNKNPESIPDSLHELMDLWRYQPPWDHDFSSKVEVFPAASYQYVLYGMGYKTHLPVNNANESYEYFAKRKIEENKRMISAATSALPGNRELLNKIKKYGFQRV